jgi:hypothetical protein
VVVVAGHRGDVAVARAHIADGDAGVRAAALGALERCGALTADDLASALGDPDSGVRRRAIELAATRPGDEPPSLLAMLGDADTSVVEVAAWACGEREPAEDGAVGVLAEIATRHDDALCREAAVAALGALGDTAGLPAILAACGDKATVRRRAVLALAPFAGPEVDAALARAATDRDAQVRQAAEDISSGSPHS